MDVHDLVAYEEARERALSSGLGEFAEWWMLEAPIQVRASTRKMCLLASGTQRSVAHVSQVYRFLKASGASDGPL